MNDKTREQIEAMKNQTIGVEVEMNRSAGTGKPVKKTKEKRSPTHQALSRCCPKTTTAIHSYNIPHWIKLCKRF